jgi:F-type H+-transporting ATPase subunit b
MPHFLDPHMYSLSSAELWVGVGLLLFFAILVLAGVPKMIARVLDEKAAKIQSELDEAARLRTPGRRIQGSAGRVTRPSPAAG